MTQEHPITPPTELLDQWAVEYWGSPGEFIAPSERHIATQAARWGADQELEACCEWIYKLMDRGLEWSTDLRTSRRPTLSNLKEQALSELDSLENMGTCNADTIRRALESLPE
jgi:hypothetical protein